jgi:hypothetical protein
MTPCCFVYAFRLPPIYIVVFSLALVALVAAKTAAVIAWRTRGTYPCTTTIDKEGLREKTPRSDTLYTWSTIKTFSVIDGDFYFYTTFGGGFIPSCAFANRADALNFVLQATALRHGARNPKNDWPSQDKNQDGRSK